jgi:hypothetical protein
MKREMTQHQCGVAAEAYIACLLAQSGYDVLVQYGANLADYDLVAVKGNRILKISVKGSQDGGWMLAVRFVKPGVDYHAAIEKWLSVQPDGIVYLFVQFKNVALGQAPRVFVARPNEIAAHMKSQCSGRGHGSLQEDYLRDHPGSKYNHKIPAEWNFSRERIDVI